MGRKRKRSPSPPVPSKRRKVDKANLTPDAKMRIFVEGWKYEAELAICGKGMFSYAELGRRAGVHHTTAKLWWRREEEFRSTGILPDRPRTGRPRAPSLRTDEQVEALMDEMEDAPEGTHLDYFAKKHEVSERTIQRRVQGKGLWRIRPGIDPAFNDKTQDKRLQYCDAVLTPTGRLKRKFQTATWVDNKQVHVYGINKTQTKAFRRIGNPNNKPIERRQDPKVNPKIHCLFAANKEDLDVFCHADVVPYQRKEGSHIENRSVDGLELRKGVLEMVVPLMEKTDSTVAILDCVPVNHCGHVAQAFEDSGLELYASNGRGHNIPGGYPPTSHDCSILDGDLFANFQNEISKVMQEKFKDRDVNGPSKTALLYEEIPRVWKTEQRRKEARIAVAKQARVLQRIREVGGAMTSRSDIN